MRSSLPQLVIAMSLIWASHRVASIFTWWNGRIEEDFILKRLDRCPGNHALLELYTKVEVEHLARVGSEV